MENYLYVENAVLDLNYKLKLLLPFVQTAKQKFIARLQKPVASVIGKNWLWHNRKEETVFRQRETYFVCSNVKQEILSL